MAADEVDGVGGEHYWRRKTRRGADMNFTKKWMLPDAWIFLPKKDDLNPTAAPPPDLAEGGDGNLRGLSVDIGTSTYDHRLTPAEALQGSFIITRNTLDNMPATADPLRGEPQPLTTRMSHGLIVGWTYPFRPPEMTRTQWDQVWRELQVDGSHFESAVWLYTNTNRD